MKTVFVLTLALAALAGQAAAKNCEGLECGQSCGRVTLADGTVTTLDPVQECVVDANGIETLNCPCPDPPEGSTPVPDSRAAQASPSPNPPADNGDDVNDLPPDGGSGTILPSQTNGDKNAVNSGAPSSSLSAALLAAGALAAGAVVFA